MTEDNRDKSFTKTEKALRLFSTLSSEDLSSLDKRIEAIKSMDFDTFFKILAFTNGLLKEGVPRHSGDPIKLMSVSMAGVSDFESSINAIEHLKEFFLQFKAEINTDNYINLATKLYTAIIFTHLFSDANGRLARAAYYFVTTGKLLEKSKITERPTEVVDFAYSMYETAVYALLIDDLDISEEKKPNIIIWDYKAEESRDDFILSQLTSCVRYLAANRVLKRNNIQQEGTEIDLSDKKVWSAKMKNEYALELEVVKKELFTKTLSLVDKYSQWAEDTVKKICGVDEIDQIS